MTRSRRVKPRARRTRAIAASVPDETSRTFSTDGTASTISAASSTSLSVGAPKLVPSSAASRTASTVSGSACPKISGPHDCTQSSSAPAVGRLEVGALAARDEERLVEADRPHRADGRVDAAGDQLWRAVPELAPRLTAMRRAPSPST